MTLQLEYGVHARKSVVGGQRRPLAQNDDMRSRAKRVHARRKSSDPSIEHTNQF